MPFLTAVTTFVSTLAHAALGIVLDSATLSATLPNTSVAFCGGAAAPPSRSCGPSPARSSVSWVWSSTHARPTAASTSPDALLASDPPLRSNTPREHLRTAPESPRASTSVLTGAAHWEASSSAPNDASGSPRVTSSRGSAGDGEVGATAHRRPLYSNQNRAAAWSGGVWRAGGHGRAVHVRGTSESRGAAPRTWGVPSLTHKGTPPA